MVVITAARNLGVILQQDERYKKFIAAKEANDNDAALQEMIGEFNVARMNVECEFQKEEADRDLEKIREFNVTIRQLYGKIMCTDSMMEFNKVKNELDELMKRVNGIIELSLAGQDPLTCEPEVGCTGSCDSCSGCH